jgi:hypothetical protein
MRKLTVKVNAEYRLSDEDNAHWEAMTDEQRSERVREIEEGTRELITDNMNEGAVITAVVRMVVIADERNQNG